MQPVLDPQNGKAVTLPLFSFRSPHMRAFHITWLTFFLCFFGWFGIAPLMPVIREELHLNKSQIGTIVIASVAITVVARLLVGWLCDRIGPRITYVMVLVAGAIPVIFIGLSRSYESFLLFRLCIGVLGASFVITQYHTSVMFAPNIVGTANATAAGWGNLGGGVTQMLMPVLFGVFVGLGYVNATAWRLSMIIPGVALLVMAVVYYFCTQDTPKGNLKDLRRQNPEYRMKGKAAAGSFRAVCRDYRVWVLVLAYGACFGIEITLDNIAALYFVDNFHLGLKEAGIIAGTFGCMNIFARALGGVVGDKAGNRFGLKGRIAILGICLLLEGLGMMVFSAMTVLPIAIGTLLFFALFVKMSNGATYSVVPFINNKLLGTVSGIVGAGGNVGAVLAGFVFKSENITYRQGLFILGIAVSVVALIALLLAFVQYRQQMSEASRTVALAGEMEAA